MEWNTDNTSLYNLRDILTIFFKHRRKIVIVFLVLSLASLVLYLWKSTVAYNATARIMVKFGREFVSKSELGSERQTFTPQSVMATEIQLIRSPDLISKVLQSVGPDKVYPEFSGIGNPEQRLNVSVQNFVDKLKIEIVPNTSMIDIVFIHPEPKIAVTVLNELLELMKEKHLQTFSGNSTEFLEQQFQNYAAQLKHSEARWQEYKQRTGVFAVDEQRSGLLQQKITFEAALRTTQTHIAELEHRLALLKSGKGSVEPAQDTKARLLALQEKEQGLLLRYNENSRSIQNVRSEIAALKRSLHGLAEDERAGQIAKLESELSTMRTRADTHRQQIAQLSGQLHALDSRAKETQEIRREISSQESNYQTYLRKLEEARISDDMDKQKMVAIKIVEEARIGREKPSSVRQKIAGMGLIGAILGGFALALLLEFLSPVLTTPLEAERRLGVPVMIAILKK